jgi:hypothetical protein
MCGIQYQRRKPRKEPKKPSLIRILRDKLALRLDLHSVSSQLDQVKMYRCSVFYKQRHPGISWHCELS